jgi:D-glycero-alpha-D-manno-heptose 1-phosphate guanylyltransferase
MKPLIVLAGGFGTRLRALVTDVPKPLAPVAEKPFLVHLIEHWIAHDVKEFIFLLHFEAHLIEAILLELLSDKRFGHIKIDVIVETKPLGTGGAILNAVSELGITDSFLVVNADTWLGHGYRELSAADPCALAAVSVSNSQRYGSLVFDEYGISEFKEKSKSNGQAFISSGLYHLLPDIFEGFDLGSSFSLEEEIFPNLVSKNMLGVVKLNTSFIDIGIPEDYLKFCKWIDSEKKNDL